MKTINRRDKERSRDTVSSTISKYCSVVMAILLIVAQAIAEVTEGNDVSSIVGCINVCSCQWNNKMTEISAACHSIPSTLDHRVKRVKVMDAVIVLLDKMMLMALNSVEELDLSNNHIKTLNQAFTKSNKYKVIRLSNNKITQITQQIFGNMTYLEELHMDNNAIRAVQSATFHRMTRLKIIKLQNNNLMEIQFITLLPRSIQELNLYGNFITNIPHNDQRVNLEKLNLCSNSIEIAENLFGMKELKELCLEGVKYMSVKGLQSSLTSLVLSAANNDKPIKLSDNIRLNIGNLQNLINLTIVNYEISTLKFMKQLNNLKKIELIKVKAGNEVKITDMLEYKNKLRELNLNQSYTLAHNLLQQFPTSIPNSITLSLQKTGLKTLLDYNGQVQNITIDIQDNPLDCTASNWVWIKEKHVESSKLFINESELTCKYPKVMEGIKFLDAMSEKIVTDSIRMHSIEIMNSLSIGNCNATLLTTLLVITSVILFNYVN